MFGKPMSTHCAEIGCNIMLMILIQYKLLYYIRCVFHVFFSKSGLFKAEKLQPALSAN